MSQPIVFTTTRFKCPYCPHSRANRKPVVEHIARCWHNPDNRGCKTCEHYSEGDNGCGAPGCGPSCASPESCDVGVDFTDGPRIHCEQWEAAS